VASSAWVWVPDDATVVEDEQYGIVRLPDYFEYQLKVLEFRPSGPLSGAIDAASNAATVTAGGGMLVAYVDGEPSGSGGVTMADGVARLWGGVVVPSARGQGIYRAVLDARLSYAVERGATMGLVKGKIDTSGPILRRAGFAAFGQESIYDVPL
jgi:GNAT superfamily N-acetyltransferase